MAFITIRKIKTSIFYVYKRLKYFSEFFTVLFLLIIFFSAKVVGNTKNQKYQNTNGK